MIVGPHDLALNRCCTLGYFRLTVPTLLETVPRAESSLADGKNFTFGPNPWRFNHNQRVE